MCMSWNKSSNSKFTLFISQYFPNWFLCFFSNRALSLEISWLFCHTVMVGHLTFLYLQSKKCTNIILDILKVVLMPFAVLWLMAPFRWYPLFNKNQAAWNFLSPELEVTWRTVAIIIQVVFSFPIFVNSWRFSVFHSLQSITPRIY
jgi:hypothetical protein